MLTNRQEIARIESGAYGDSPHVEWLPLYCQGVPLHGSEGWTTPDWQGIRREIEDGLDPVLRFNGRVFTGIEALRVHYHLSAVYWVRELTRGGNSFGEKVVIGTKDAFDLTLRVPAPKAKGRVQ